MNKEATNQNDSTFKSISLEDVEKHNSPTDFWTIIDNEVYDLTQFAKRHPGGPIIMAAAGTDSTILFENYHFQMDIENIKLMMKKYKIGKVSDHVSPIMGPFYKALCAKVTDKLKTKDRHPLRSKVLFFADVIVGFLAIASGSRCGFETSPYILLLNWLVLSIVIQRLNGHSHAITHMHVFGGKFVSIAEAILLLIGNHGLPVYVLPSIDSINFRSLLNRQRIQSQSEYQNRRGPYEHQSIHHVKGTEMDIDQCQFVCTKLGLLRMNPSHPLRFFHRLQHFLLYQIIVEIIFETVTTVIGGFFLRTSLFFTLLYFGDLKRAALTFFGFISVYNIARTVLLLPLSSYFGFFLFIFAHLIKYYFEINEGGLFFSQHIWDNNIPDDEAKKDWGKFNAEVCGSLWGASMPWHPFFWFQSGASANTLSYHLEHTLFPGLNYLHLPYIAETVEQTCKEFGIKYNKLHNLHDFHYKFRAHLEKYSVANKKSD
jgi:cytochrome b involved in lipid metabolism